MEDKVSLKTLPDEEMNRSGSKKRFVDDQRPVNSKEQELALQKPV